LNIYTDNDLFRDGINEAVLKDNIFLPQRTLSTTQSTQSIVYHEYILCVLRAYLESLVVKKHL